VRIFAIGGSIIGSGSMHSFYYQYVDPAVLNIVIAYVMAVIAGGRGARRAPSGCSVVMVLLRVALSRTSSPASI
jgi:ABC-type branched-subunit amino acid transport system permease subunit